MSGSFSLSFVFLELSVILLECLLSAFAVILTCGVSAISERCYSGGKELSLE